ncbi:MAG TPA: hypothetical protein VGU45_13680 [Microvirga sp.]|nr:hypothetical protein [Microvirga sp.]
MALFYFHIRKGEELERAAEPIALQAAGEIGEEAVELARDLLAEGDLAGLDRRAWVFEVADETGATVLTFPFRDAIEPDLPEADR